MGVGTILPILLSQFQVSVGANPVQVEVGEFDDGPEETEEEVVAESTSLPCDLAHPSCPWLPGSGA